jgi:hypothetical protein
MLFEIIYNMEIVKIPNEKITFKYGTVDKHAVVFQDTIVYTGSKPQCHRFVHYMEGSSPQEILNRVKLK